MESQKTSRWRFRLQGISYKKVFLPLGVLVIALDQLSKLWVRETLAPYASVPVEGFLRISHVVNRGLIFGIDVPAAIGLLLPTAAMAVALFLYWRYVPLNSRLLGLAMGLFVGGCLSNMVDRIALGGVTDIIDINVSDSIGRLVFNVADLCCMAGIIVFDVFLIRLRLVRVPKRQYLLSYLWRSFVAVERSRSQAGQWWKPAFLRPGNEGTAIETSSGTGSTAL